jgi:hypothetical protein
MENEKEFPSNLSHWVDFLCAARHAPMWPAPNLANTVVAGRLGHIARRPKPLLGRPIGAAISPVQSGTGIVWRGGAHAVQLLVSNGDPACGKIFT